MKDQFVLVIAAVFLAVSIMGCNTMRGAGKDVESAGQGVQKVVDHND